MLGPGAVGAVGMPGLSIRAVSVRRRSPLWARWRRWPQPVCRPLVSSPSSARLGFLSGGGVSVPYLPLSVLLRNSFSLVGHSGGFVPPGHLLHSRGIDALRLLDSPSHSLTVPPWIFPPLLRPCGPPSCPTLLRTLRPGFTAVRQTFPLPIISPYGGLLLTPRLRPQRRPPRCRSFRPL